MVGVERGGGRRGGGHGSREAVAPAVRMLQPLALPPATRARAAGVDGLLDDLRTQVVQTTGAEGLELEDLERIKPRTVLIVVASTLAFYSLLPQLANLQATFDAFGAAQPAWIVAAVLASARHLPVRGGVLPGGGGGPAAVRAEPARPAGLVVRRPGGPGGGRGVRAHGPLPPARRGAAGGGGRLRRRERRRRLRGAPHPARRLRGVVGSLRPRAGSRCPTARRCCWWSPSPSALVGVLLAIRPVRRRVVAPLWASIKVGATQIGRVFRSPVRVAALFGGSVGISLAYVAAVFCTIEAFGGGLTLPAGRRRLPRCGRAGLPRAHARGPRRRSSRR